MKRLIFRFDIDTHKCIRDGVPALLDVAEWEQVPFTFFLNLGRAVSIKMTLKQRFSVSQKVSTEIPVMMSAMQKLGFRDYLVAAVLNPCISNYSCQIRQLLMSNCEVGLHGGHNHADWGNQTVFTSEYVRQEVGWALQRMNELCSKLSLPVLPLKGFASPEWNSPWFLPEILKEKGFSYLADLRCAGQNPIRKDGVLPRLGVNLLGEPGGVAFFENCSVKQLSDKEIIQTVMDSFIHLDTVVLYDHPYYAGEKKLSCIRKLIQEAKKRGIQICRLEELLQ